MKTWVTAAMLVFLRVVETVCHWANRFDQGSLRTESIIIMMLTVEIMLNMNLIDKILMRLMMIKV